MSLYNILISGAGQLGSRYLQGLTKSKLNLNIFIYDINPISIINAKERLSEVVDSYSNLYIKFIDNLEQIPKTIDLVIVSTTADSRLNAIQVINKNANVKNWILEKVLAQSIFDLNEIVKITKDSNGVWVNLPRRIYKIYNNLKTLLNKTKKLSIKVNGYKWGIACNSIHFLDLVSWLSETELVSISLEKLERKWVSSKRKGFFDIEGIAFAEYSNGSTLELSSNDNKDQSLVLELEQDHDIWKIDEERGIISNFKGIEIINPTPFQSDITAEIVENILLHSKSELPTMQHSFYLHKIYLDAFLKHWNQNMENKTQKLPVT